MSSGDRPSDDRRNWLGWDESGAKLLCDDLQVVEVGIHCGDLAVFEAVDDCSFVREWFSLSRHTVIVADYAAPRLHNGDHEVALGNQLLQSNAVVSPGIGVDSLAPRLSTRR